MRAPGAWSMMLSILNMLEDGVVCVLIFISRLRPLKGSTLTRSTTLKMTSSPSGRLRCSMKV